MLDENEILGVFPARSGQDGLTPSEINPLFSNINNTFDEKITGKWPDNRNIYSKTFNIVAPISTGIVNIPHNINDFDNVIAIKNGYFNFSAIPSGTIFPNYATNNCGLFTWSTTDLTLFIDAFYTGANAINEINFTIEFLKTT